MNLELFSPEEVSEKLRGKVSAWTLRKLAREKKIDHTRFERGKILFTEAQVHAFLQRWEQPANVRSHAEIHEVPLVFQGTSRSRKAHVARGAVVG